MAVMEADRKLKINIAVQKKSHGTVKGNKMENKHYQVNINMALFNFKYMMIRLFSRRTKPHIVLLEFIRIIGRYYEPVIPHRTNSRRYKSYKTRGKYATYTNYARAI